MCILLIQTYDIQDCFKAYVLDGTESISSITSYPTPTIANNVLSDGLGYLSDGFDNTGNWKLEFKYKASGAGAGFILIPTGITARDKYFVQLWERNSVSFRDPNSSVSGGSSFTAFDPDTWVDVEITKQSTTLTVVVDNTQRGQATISTLSNYNTLYVGLDYMNKSTYHSAIKEIKIKPL